MAERAVEFDLTDEDTCMKHWTINVQGKGKEHAPDPRFKDYIQCYWTLNCSKNCLKAIYGTSSDAGMELIFNLAAPIECTVDNHPPVMISGDFLVGSLARQIQIKPTGTLSLFAIRFTPEGLYPFLSMPPVDLSDFSVEIEEVWELNGFGLSKLIHGTGQVPERRIKAFERFFARRINDFRSHSLHVEKAVTIICSHKGQIPVKNLANQLQISSRQLERIFLTRIGVSPKQLCRIIRLKSVLNHLNPGEYDWASLAVARGYFDQAHFNHEFKFFTGKNPMAYLQERSAMTFAS